MKWWPWLVVAPSLSYLCRMVMVVLLFRAPFTLSEVLSSNNSNSNASALQLNEDGFNIKNDSLTETASSEIRCHCNLPVCVSTGYMCKSAGGACFTQYTPVQGSQQHPRNPSQYQTLSSVPSLGCLHLLHQDLQDICRQKSRQKASLDQNTPPGSALLVEKAVENLPKGSINQGKSLEEDLRCCGQDMCNYQDTPGSRVEGRSHDTIKAGKQDTSVMGSVWFQTATVAVPVAGCIILVLLVLMAARILAKDSKRHRTYQVCGDHYVKTPLYSAMSTSSGPEGSGNVAEDNSCISQHSSHLHFCSHLHSTLEQSYEDSRTQPQPHYLVRPPPYREKNGVYCSYDEHHQIEELKPLNYIHDIKSCEVDCPNQRFKYLDNA
ncbi:uncharacterized protein LOC143033915 [Oratosquilla oratoria]|uniref:uncharacterized protein LOC143033915 n=1 Tax=Oratosquilla oratoria TaxID=337810 RepID=UPI003F76CAF9